MKKARGSSVWVKARPKYLASRSKIKPLSRLTVGSTREALREPSAKALSKLYCVAWIWARTICCS